MRLWRDDCGATVVEYGLVIGLIAGAVVTAAASLGTEVSQAMDDSAAGLSQVNAGSPGNGPVDSDSGGPDGTGTDGDSGSRSSIGSGGSGGSNNGGPGANESGAATGSGSENTADQERASRPDFSKGEGTGTAEPAGDGAVADGGGAGASDTVPDDLVDTDHGDSADSASEAANCKGWGRKKDC